tara:strand:+ start:74 stop:373 length:300 start_codon:yes stop_codon:yes gene_type:complete
MSIDKEYHAYIEAQRELVEAHIHSSHSISLMMHVSIAGNIVDNYFQDMDDYKSSCESNHINSYDMLAERYFKAYLIYKLLSDHLRIQDADVVCEVTALL